MAADPAPLREISDNSRRNRINAAVFGRCPSPRPGVALEFERRSSAKGRRWELSCIWSIQTASHCLGARDLLQQSRHILGRWLIGPEHWFNLDWIATAEREASARQPTSYLAFPLPPFGPPAE